MSEDRAERAFRDALAKRAEETTPKPLDVPTRRRTPRLMLAAAAALLVVAGGLGILQSMRGGEQSQVATDPQPHETDPAAPAAGWQWISWRDLEVQVPAEWQYAFSPANDWCVDHIEYPDGPYVAFPGTRITMMIACEEEFTHPAEFGPAPERLWAPHVALHERQFDDGVATHGDWTATIRTFGDLQLTVITDADTTPLVDSIVESARQVQVDHAGCDVTSPVQATDIQRPDPFDLATMAEVDQAAICLYNRIGTEQPGLAGSRTLGQAEARELLAAVLEAPVGGGPDEPESCLEGSYGDTAFVVRWHTGEGVRDMYAYADWCFGNGFDDGTNLREVTWENCRMLQGGAVHLWAGAGPVSGRCLAG
ncbi:hypothetical protein [Nocardioides limicola]|uniref:hypothetical protein n=1 Tax=Nocardioides limicola TaxID=2803368 RepID=UPI00193C6E9A|nr:hypothetical protein [Nocardioides sp. DJM-14]